MYQIVYYRTLRGDCPVLEFIESLDEKAARKVEAFIELLGQKGPDLHRPYADKIRGPICELRVQFAHRSIRTLYFFMHGADIVLLHSFLKRTDAVEERDVRLAESRMLDWLNRNGGQ